MKKSSKHYTCYGACYCDCNHVNNLFTKHLNCEHTLLFVILPTPQSTCVDNLIREKAR
jgi:hypothetical protein